MSIIINIIERVSAERLRLHETNVFYEFFFRVYTFATSLLGLTWRIINVFLALQKYSWLFLNKCINNLKLPGWSE